MRNHRFRLLLIGSFVFVWQMVAAGTLRAQVELLPPVEAESDNGATLRAYAIGDFLELAVENNPQLRSAAFAIDAARGNAVQAGLYPNPTLMITGEEIGRKNGGIHTWPGFTQQIVTAGKRRLNMAVADRNVEINRFKLNSKQLEIINSVRQQFVDLLALQQRLVILDELRQAVAVLYDIAKKRQKLLGTELDVLAFQMELNQLDLQKKNNGHRYLIAWRQLVATIGVPHLRSAPVFGSLNAPLPLFDYSAVHQRLLALHPDVQAARIAVDKAELSVVRARRGAVPDVKIGAGYQRNFNDSAHQATYQVQIPVPIFNRNQGTVLSAKANLGRAVENERNTQYTLLRRLASSWGRYELARQQAEYARRTIVPTAQRMVKLSRQAFEGNQANLAVVLLAQQSLRKAKTEQLDALRAAWLAAAELAALSADATFFLLMQR